MRSKLLPVTLFILFSLTLTAAFAQLENIKVIKKVDYNSKLISKSGGDPLYKMTIGFNDIDGKYHQLPQTFMSEENETMYKPCIYFDQVNYFIFAKSLDESFKGYVFRFNPTEGFTKEIVFTDRAMGYLPFFGKPNNAEPSLYFVDRGGASRVVKAQRDKGNWTTAYTDMEIATQVSLYFFTDQAQWYKNSYKQFPFKIYNTKVSPFVPVYCEGDDISFAKEKPAVSYEEVANTKIEIPNMPWIEAQSLYGECEAFSAAVLLQKMTCEKWKKDIPDCANPPADSKISYFGMLKYIHVDTNYNFQFRYRTTNIKDASSSYPLYARLKHFLEHPQKLILASSKPFYTISETLFGDENKADIDGSLKKRDDFMNYLLSFYNNNKARTLNEATKNEFYKRFEFYTGWKSTGYNLDVAIKSTTVDKFVEHLFFDNSAAELFPAASVHTYPLSYVQEGSVLRSTVDYKNKIIEILKLNKPCILAGITYMRNLDGTNPGINHCLVVCGYKEVYDRQRNMRKSLFKVHNSEGPDWQKSHNNGWIDADSLMESLELTWDAKLMKVNNRDMSIIWIPY